ncbi:hypothetical protein EWM62_01340 [Mucilaginibacter terrigena]|uniref:Uncharacterized protein n=1 Tax=Mucilaginibacter terrigena TaxID=2492395 RepID=A0A4Q5LRN6_9SPHI|nr:hypothetical protein [Mucilaginibacter terrigena]RYU92114.1 hypothetical protein EWM62_01340 [Mucilaginibacter terrigena]
MIRAFKNSRPIFAGCVLIFILFASILSACSKKDVKPAPPGVTGTKPVVVVVKDTTVSISIDRSQKLQQIDGFGFFGGRAPWWADASEIYSDDWANQVINDLGITIWRNELYSDSPDQDATWDKQRPVVEGLNKVAKAAKVPLKFIFTVWSPPANLKCKIGADNKPISGTPNPTGTKNGGALDPAKYTEYGNYLANGLQLYKDAGVNVYAISPQNEPLFVEPYNSCVYNNMDGSYAAMLANVIPVVKSKFPGVKVFGAENMLDMEGGKDRQYFYNTSIKNSPDALKNIDIWAMHGYTEGINPSSGSVLEGLWNTVKTEYITPTQKPAWMTETSGYDDNWLKTGKSPGAMDLASDIQSALYYGQASAWVWWEASDKNINEYTLMAANIKGKKYYASKHFYRFIRPGARMVKLNFKSTDHVTATAFENTQMNSFTIVLINSSANNVKLDLNGDNLPDNYDYYYTTSAVGDNCKKKDGRVKKTDIVLPPYSVVTLVNGNVFE